ncbi:AAA family ATPase [Halomonas sp. EGI 63088]|uniref:AAA family ATPase n=1 Tax=Halomonas flagellata TaxID=2920385 RepID=A0ABS9RXE8_9GAMM|nr:Lon-like protease helical domain-containing protein [Halomonas flagellata]MCH4564512.1 AAA family ATPase [Halomonas flagellata]
MVQPLDVIQVYWECAEDAFDFEVTSELDSLEPVFRHPRAHDALGFGTAIRSDGFNLFVLGSPDHGRHGLVSRFLAERAKQGPSPADACYLHNFDAPARPRYLAMPVGMGRGLRADLEQLAEELRDTIPPLSSGGEVLMPPDDYGFSARFTWLNDRFGVSWQLNLT